MPDQQDGSPPSITCRECRLGRFTVYGKTVATSPDFINSRRRDVRIIAPQRTILREGEVPTHIHTLYSGWAFRFIQLKDGRRQILSFHIPGDTIPLESLCVSGFRLPFAVRSLTQVTLCSFLLADSMEIFQTTDAQRNEVSVALQRHIANLNHRMLDIGRRSALGRVAQLLLEIESRLKRRQLSQNGAFEFPARQEHLADALGLTTVYVNRTLDRLRKLDVIAFDRNRMTIRNFDRLREISEEE